MILILILYALFAAFYVVGKELLACSPPLFLSAARTLGGGILLTALHGMMHTKPLVVNRRSITLLALYTVSTNVISFALAYWALQYLSTTKVIFYYTFAPFITAFLSYFLFNEKMNRMQWLGSCVALLGIIPVMIMYSGTDGAGMTPPPYYLADIGQAVSVVLYAYGWIVVKQLIEEFDYPAIGTNGISLLASGVILLIGSVLVDGIWPVCNASHFLLWLAILIGLSTTCYVLYFVLLKRYSPTLVSFGGFLEPLFGAFYNWILFGEHLTWYFWLSFAGITCGLYLFHYHELKNH